MGGQSECKSRLQKKSVVAEKENTEFKPKEASDPGSHLVVAYRLA